MADSTMTQEQIEQQIKELENKKAGLFVVQINKDEQLVPQGKPYEENDFKNAKKVKFTIGAGNKIEITSVSTFRHSSWEKKELTGVNKSEKSKYLKHIQNALDYIQAEAAKLDQEIENLKQQLAVQQSKSTVSQASSATTVPNQHDGSAVILEGIQARAAGAQSEEEKVPTELVEKIGRKVGNEEDDARFFINKDRNDEYRQLFLNHREEMRAIKNEEHKRQLQQQAAERAEKRKTMAAIAPTQDERLQQQEGMRRSEIEKVEDQARKDLKNQATHQQKEGIERSKMEKAEDNARKDLADLAAQEFAQVAFRDQQNDSESVSQIHQQVPVSELDSESAASVVVETAVTQSRKPLPANPASAVSEQSERQVPLMIEAPQLAPQEESIVSSSHEEYSVKQTEMQAPQDHSARAAEDTRAVSTRGVIQASEIVPPAQGTRSVDSRAGVIQASEIVPPAQGTRSVDSRAGVIPASEIVPPAQGTRSVDSRAGVIPASEIVRPTSPASVVVATAETQRPGNLVPPSFQQPRSGEPLAIGAAPNDQSNVIPPPASDEHADPDVPLNVADVPVPTELGTTHRQSPTGTPSQQTGTLYSTEASEPSTAASSSRARTATGAPVSPLSSTESSKTSSSASGKSSTPTKSPMPTLSSTESSHTSSSAGGKSSTPAKSPMPTLSSTESSQTPSTHRSSIQGSTVAGDTPRDLVGAGKPDGRSDPGTSSSTATSNDGDLDMGAKFGPTLTSAPSETSSGGLDVEGDVGPEDTRDQQPKFVQKDFLTFDHQKYTVKAAVVTSSLDKKEVSAVRVTTSAQLARGDEREKRVVSRVSDMFEMARRAATDEKHPKPVMRVNRGGKDLVNCYIALCEIYKEAGIISGLDIQPDAKEKEDRVLVEQYKRALASKYYKVNDFDGTSEVSGDVAKQVAKQFSLVNSKGTSNGLDASQAAEAMNARMQFFSNYDNENAEEKTIIVDQKGLFVDTTGGLFDRLHASGKDEPTEYGCIDQLAETDVYANLKAAQAGYKPKPITRSAVASPTSFAMAARALGTSVASTGGLGDDPHPVSPRSSNGGSKSR